MVENNSTDTSKNIKANFVVSYRLLIPKKKYLVATWDYDSNLTIVWLLIIFVPCELAGLQNPKSKSHKDNLERRKNKSKKRKKGKDNSVDWRISRVRLT